MDSLRVVLLSALALGAGALALLNLSHLAVMAALRLRLVASVWLGVTVLLLALAIGFIHLQFHAAAIWTPLLAALVLGAPASRELADAWAWRRDRDLAKTGWLAMIDRTGPLGYRGHIYRAAAANERVRFETFDESQDPWLTHWTDGAAPLAKPSISPSVIQAESSEDARGSLEAEASAVSEAS